MASNRVLNEDGTFSKPGRTKFQESPFKKLEEKIFRLREELVGYKQLKKDHAELQNKYDLLLAEQPSKKAKK
jgi:hypothetical protein